MQAPPDAAIAEHRIRRSQPEVRLPYQERIAAAETDRDDAVQAARDAAVTDAAERRQDAQQAGQRAAVAEARGFTYTVAEICSAVDPASANATRSS